MEKIENPVFIKEHYESFWHPIKNIKQFCSDVRQSVQRIKWGYSRYDAMDIDVWFLYTIPNMLETFLDINKGWGSYPAFFEYDAYEEHKEEIGCSFEEYRAASSDRVRELREKYDQECREKWRGIIKEMIFLFREADEDMCTKSNPYEKEYTRNRDNKEIHEKYWAEENALDEYRDECKDKAFMLFSKYFRNLWE